MKQNKDLSRKKLFNPVILYVASAIVALAGIVLLINNIIIFKSTIDQYLAQGFPASVVAKSLIPAQLIPGICEPIAVYGGIALLLLVSGVVIKRVSESQDMQFDDSVEDILEKREDKNDSETIEDNIISKDNDNVDVENVGEKEGINS